jgi:hypothetical protein
LIFLLEAFGEGLNFELNSLADFRVKELPEEGKGL